MEIYFDVSIYNRTKRKLQNIIPRKWKYYELSLIGKLFFVDTNQIEIELVVVQILETIYNSNHFLHSSF